MSENVPNEIRDIYMEKILSNPSNQICFDCGSKGPKWSSPYLGILICYECAGRHRSYGTHISFVRSVDLDKWTRKQLRSLEITGNDFTKQRFIDLGVPKEGTFYDYNNDLVLKYRQEITQKVKEDLENNPNLYREKKQNKNETNENTNFNNNNNNNNNNENFNGNNNNNDTKKENDDNMNVKKNENKNEEEETKKPTRFEIHTKEKVENIKIESKAGKKNKIKKVDFDFDFDSFNNVNFSDFNTKKENENDDEKINEKFLDDEDKEEEERNREKKTFTGNAYNIKISKEEVNKKFANKKAISSDDYAALEDNNFNNKFVQSKIKSMGNSQAISSDDIYGRNDNDYSESFGERLKDMAINFTLKAAEKAKELKNKTNDYINKLQNQYNGYGS